MHEPDDRLAGDPVWELFPQPDPHPRRDRTAPEVALLIVVIWFLYPPLSVTLACLAASFGEFQTGKRLARSIPDKAGGGICSLFSYAWGAWKFGVAAFALMFVTAFLGAQARRGGGPPLGSTTAALLWLGGFVASAALTAAGLVKAIRSGMRVWMGAGINQARTLMLGMLMVGFVFSVLIPLCMALAVVDTRTGESWVVAPVFVLGLIACMFGGPVIILIVLDWLHRRVVADTPGESGPKVPTVGRWNH